MPLDNRQQKWLPPLGLNPRACVQDTATSYPGIRFPEVGQVYASAHQFRYLQPPLLPAYDQQVSRLNRDVAPEKAIKCSQKRFLIFDQSGEKTRLLQCGFPLRFPSSTAAEAAKGFGKDPAKMLLHEDHVNDQEESEMHEDTEEINALLYSDDDDDCESDDDDDDDDEVKSTGQSPFTVEQQACNNKTTQVLDETESSDDDDDGPRRKRQKLLDHSYRDSSLSLVGTESFTKLKDLSDEKLLESNIITKQEETGSGLSDEESRKDKIHTALRILESVVPGAKGKEALLLLDEAIDYLKSLKRNLNGLINNH